MGAILDIINQNDPLQVVLRSHLILERLVIELIESVLPNPAAIDLMALSYTTRVNLAVALDVLPQDMVGRFRRFNRIRNRFAHKLDSNISDEDISVLWDSLIRYDRDALQLTSFEERNNIGKFGGFVLITYYRLKQIHSFLEEPDLEREWEALKSKTEG